MSQVAQVARKRAFLDWFVTAKGNHGAAKGPRKAGERAVSGNLYFEQTPYAQCGSTVLAASKRTCFFPLRPGPGPVLRPVLGIHVLSAWGVPPRQKSHHFIPHRSPLQARTRSGGSADENKHLPGSRFQHFSQVLLTIALGFIALSTLTAGSRSGAFVFP